MSNVLLVGDDGSGSTAGMGTGACIARTIRFRDALLSHGCFVEVCSPSEGKTGVLAVRNALAHGSFHCIVAISPFPAEAAVGVNSKLPLWIDMNGMHPAELQLQDHRDGRFGERMIRMLALENVLITKGDSFSTPSRRQAYAVYGELLLLGRTMSSGNNEISVCPIPHCSSPVRNFSHDQEGGFRIISTGSFNRWFDEVTLFNGIESAIGNCRTIRFESTGGSVPFSPGKYDSFCKMVASSRHRDNFILHGWVSPAELEKVYSRASVATYTDIPCSETLLGARTRVLDWISRGIPVVCTEGAEISEDIREHNLGIVVASCDSEALAEAFVSLASNPSLRQSITMAQEKWCCTVGASAEVFKPLIRWCRNPYTVRSRQYGKSTVPEVNSSAYLEKLFIELAKSRSFPYAFRRFVRKLSRRSANPDC